MSDFLQVELSGGASQQIVDVEFAHGKPEPAFNNLFDGGNFVYVDASLLTLIQQISNRAAVSCGGHQNVANSKFPGTLPAILQGEDRLSADKRPLTFRPVIDKPDDPIPPQVTVADGQHFPDADRGFVRAEDHRRFETIGLLAPRAMIPDQATPNAKSGYQQDTEYAIDGNYRTGDRGNRADSQAV